MNECIREGTKLVQAIANTLFNFPSTETNDGPIVQLPPPTTKLPREKHVRSSSLKCKRVVSYKGVHIFECTKAC